jgi:hypothetical protein
VFLSDALPTLAQLGACPSNRKIAEAARIEFSSVASLIANWKYLTPVVRFLGIRLLPRCSQAIVPQVRHTRPENRVTHLRSALPVPRRREAVKVYTVIEPSDMAADDKSGIQRCRIDGVLRSLARSNSF